MEEGTVDSLTAALKNVEELRELLAQGTQEDTRALITKAGGIFIGKEELVKLGKLDPDAVIPEIPAKYSQAFLESTHPLRGGSIASRIIFAFDPQSNQWHTVDRGEGGKSDIVPGSLAKYAAAFFRISRSSLRSLFSIFRGKDGLGLSGEKQDELLKKNSSPIERILANALALHLELDKKPPHF